MEDIQTVHKQEGTNAVKSTFQIIVFRLEEEEYALSIDQIKEVVITPSIARIPLTQSYIKGVGNIRGNVLAIMDLADKFGISTEKNITSGTHKYTLVVASDEYKMGILVKDVPQTLRVTKDDIDESPAIVQSATLESNYIKGIIKSGNRIIVLIDIFKVISKEEQNLLARTTDKL
ncbi:chemotaxis protein CheW [Xanthocytophaga agilis]|uniref:Chemotaxis protein CheW n=1 Tax=Xanthocytophaga agilis TaxID=3048010 RepID=A0AAE3R5N6_9BACT|nr:chemotaxis protein CheW [Xanthocytophaga agilis]MDJ1501919.1 chemotaxis protein CheW [Xanthocytophaga agilis]